VKAAENIFVLQKYGGIGGVSAIVATAVQKEEV